VAEYIYLENPHGRVVEVDVSRREDLLASGYRAVDEDPEADEAPPAPTPAAETEDAESKSDDRDRIRAALESDDFNEMRGTLADRVEESTQGMGKAEVREALEELLE
jgi:hypothetical protein